MMTSKTAHEPEEELLSAQDFWQDELTFKENEPDSVPEKPIVADYLRGQIPRRRFAGMVGEKRFHALWERLAAAMDAIAQQAKQGQAKAPMEDESTCLAMMGLANSFLLWNLPDSYGAGPVDRVRVVDNSIWIFPIVLTSPGYGIVGEVGQIAVDIKRGQIVGCTFPDKVQQHGKKCNEQHKEEIKAAFLQARRA